MRSFKIYFLVSICLISFFFGKISKAEENNYVITVNFKEFKLSLTDEKGRELKNYPVALPNPSATPKNLPIRGKVLRIEKDPYWYPTESIREYYWKTKNVNLPKVIPPNSSLNAMGKAKIIMKFEEGKINEPIRIHGTNDPTSIGKRVSRGCIRMRNEDILDLISIIENKETKVIFEE
jgi:lipoprotein-anchoring transpeptidase ErfK/SrfK